MDARTHGGSTSLMLLVMVVIGCGGPNPGSGSPARSSAHPSPSVFAIDLEIHVQWGSNPTENYRFVLWSDGLFLYKKDPDGDDGSFRAGAVTPADLDSFVTTWDLHVAGTPRQSRRVRYGSDIVYCWRKFVISFDGASYGEYAWRCGSNDEIDIDSAPDQMYANTIEKQVIRRYETSSRLLLWILLSDTRPNWMQEGGRRRHCMMSCIKMTISKRTRNSSRMTAISV